jgi:hypothetical protein
MKKYTVTIIGLVERTITVEADNLEHAEHAAEREWAALTGGIIQTAEASTAIEEAE